MWNPYPVATAIAVVAISNSASAQPTHKDVAYDDQHESQVIDVYLAESEEPLPVMVHIHGGGWQAGSKSQVPGWLTQGVRNNTYHVVSVEYRFTDVASHPAQTDDCLRAIQFVRHNAVAWNVNPERIGVTGGSAGGHLSLWVALHDDVAQADADDPVGRLSSRVQCAVSFAGPTDWSLLETIDHHHPAFRQLIGSEPGTPFDQLDANTMRDTSPISFVSDDDPPIMQVQGDSDALVPVEHAKRMHAQLEKAGVVSELVLVTGGNHGVAFAGPDVSKPAIRFVKKTLLAP